MIDSGSIWKMRSGEDINMKLVKKKTHFKINKKKQNYLNNLTFLSHLDDCPDTRP